MISTSYVFKICAPRIPTFISKVPLLNSGLGYPINHLTNPLRWLIGNSPHPTLSSYFFPPNLLCLLLPHQSIVTPFFQLPKPNILKSSLTPFSLSHMPHPVHRHVFLVLPSEYLQPLTTSPHLHCFSDLISHHSATTASLVIHYETKPPGLCTCYIPSASSALSLASHQA